MLRKEEDRFGMYSLRETIKTLRMTVKDDNALKGKGDRGLFRADFYN